jgi:hypothetical protein
VQIYPDESHGLEGVLGHLHHSMEDHLAICLGNVTLGTILEPLHHTDLTTKCIETIKNRIDLSTFTIDK